MLSRKEQLPAKKIPNEARISLVNFIQTLDKLCLAPEDLWVMLMRGQVIHFCKRHYKLK